MFLVSWELFRCFEGHFVSTPNASKNSFLHLQLNSAFAEMANAGKGSTDDGNDNGERNGVII